MAAEKKIIDTAKDNGEFHSYISPSNTECAKCPAAGWREFSVKRRNAFITDYASVFMGIGRQHVIEAFSDSNKENEEGTKNHEWLATMIETGDMGIAGEPLPEYAPRLIEIYEEIRDHLADATEVWIEQRFENKGLDSGGSADCVYVVDDVLYVRDLKNGRVPVKATSWQLLRYAGAVMDYMGWPKYIKKIVLIIDATRFVGDRAEVTPEELRDFAKRILRDQMSAANKLNPDPKPGDHCRYCKAAPYCEESHEWVRSVAKRVETFDPKNDFGKMTIDELEQFYSDIHAIMSSRGIMETVKTELKRRAMLGFEKLTKATLKDGKTVHRWKPNVGPEKAPEIVKRMDSAGAIFTKTGKLKSLKQLQQLFPWSAGAIAEQYANMQNAPKEAIVAWFNTLLVNDPDALVEKKLVSPAKYIEFLPEDAREEFINTTQYSPSLFIS